MLPIATLEQRLRAQRQALFRQVAEAEEDLRWLATDVEPETEEEGQQENIARLLARLDDRGKAEIEAIDRALARIVSGDYGRCVSCRKPIAPARLEALPAAAECLPCAKAKERSR
jgi:RNA polymerase-binding transcription factor DksA